MAQLLPDKERQRPLAYLLLVIVLILFYYTFVQPPLSTYLSLGDQMESSRSTEGRYRQRIAERPLLEERIAEARNLTSQSDLFLEQTNANLAASELTTRLKDVIRTSADKPEDCQVLSQQNLRPDNSNQRFEQVAIKVRMRCEVADLAKVLYELENGTPYLFIDNVTVYRQVTRRRRGRELVSEKMLDVRFDLSGYLRA